MGITYKAFDTNLRVPVALKVINTAVLNSEVSRQRFVREARSAAKLRHRHVASVFHLGAEGETYFYAMEFIDGETVEALIKRQGPLNPILALRIVLQVARALNAAQQHGLVHRDIKPANLMLVREDDELVVKVIDFGLAKTCVPGEGEEDAATLSLGGFVGTPHFASPEQLEDSTIDVRSDIYSLGVTLWYMLAGHTPFGGSMAQVMSQHLTKQPPFEKLTSVPEPVSKLLRKMLAKDPAARHQTPAELRQDVEDCLTQISGGPIAAAARVAVEEENFATLLDNSQFGTETATFEIGALLAGRYEIVSSLGESNTGRLFTAKDTSRDGALVRLLVLRHELTEDRALYTQLEREVERLSPIQHPHLLRVYALETVDVSSFLVLDAPNGFSLIELLRARRELEPQEVLPILEQISDGVDFAATSGLRRLDLALHQIHIHFPESSGVSTPRTLLKEPVTNWPPFEVRVSPLGITRELAASETWAGGETLVGGMNGGAKPTGSDTNTSYLKALAGIAYELLGGTLSPLGGGSSHSSRYSPLAPLTEAGNDVVRRTLQSGAAFPSAMEFTRALRAAEATEVRRRDSDHGSVTHAGQSTVPIQQQITPPKPTRTKIPFGFVGGLITMGTVAAILYFAIKGSNEGTAKKESRPKVTETTPATPPPVTNGDQPTVTPEKAEVVETPPAEPTRQDLLKAAVASAEVLESGANWKRAIEAWLKVAKQFPESEIGRVRLELLIQRLRDRSEPMNDTELEQLRSVLTEAAQLDVLAAMMLLAETLREREPATSFKWYSAAAAKGESTAMTQVGLMLSNGAGTERDLAKAVIYLQMAADKDDAAAKAALAECFLYGKGVEKDEAKAILLLKESSDKGNVRAMNRLGMCYHQGIGVKTDYAEAFRLFSKASEFGSAEAMGNLGVLYIKGDGVPQNPKKAIELFEKGAKLGNGYCMYQLARCYESGTGVATSANEALKWYKKSADAGHPASIEIIRKRGGDSGPKAQK
jgi:TPR repeat protein/serine/threonine protein kinase